LIQQVASYSFDDTMMTQLKAAAALLEASDGDCSRSDNRMLQLPPNYLVHPFTAVTSAQQLLLGFQQTLDCLKLTAPRCSLMMWSAAGKGTRYYSNTVSGDSVVETATDCCGLGKTAVKTLQLLGDILPARLQQLAQSPGGRQELALLYAYLYDAVGRRSMFEVLGVLHMTSGRLLLSVS
jgi:hypothetical protein